MPYFGSYGTFRGGIDESGGTQKIDWSRLNLPRRVTESAEVEKSAAKSSQILPKTNNGTNSRRVPAKCCCSWMVVTYHPIENGGQQNCT